MGWLVSGTIYVDGGDPASLRRPTDRRNQAPAHTDQWISLGSPVSQVQPFDDPTIARGPARFRPGAPGEPVLGSDQSSPSAAPPYWREAEPARPWRTPPFRPTESDRYPWAGDVPPAPVGWDSPQPAQQRQRAARPAQIAVSYPDGPPVTSGTGIIMEWQSEQALARRNPTLRPTPPDAWAALGDQLGSPALYTAATQEQPSPVRRPSPLRPGQPRDDGPVVWIGALFDPGNLAYFDAATQQHPGAVHAPTRAKPAQSPDDTAAALLAPIAPGLAVPGMAWDVPPPAARSSPIRRQAPADVLVLDVSQAVLPGTCPDAGGGIVYRPRPWRASESWIAPAWIEAGVIVVSGPYWAVALDLSPVGIAVVGEVT